MDICNERRIHRPPPDGSIPGAHHIQIPARRGILEAINPIPVAVTDKLRVLSEGFPVKIPLRSHTVAIVDRARSLARRRPLPIVQKLRQGRTHAANDHMAMGVLDTLKEEGFRVPEDIAVVGFDDIEMASLPGVELTTVSQKKTSMGRLAVDHLVEKIKGESSDLAKRIILDPSLVIRKTCGYHLQETLLQRGRTVTITKRKGRKPYRSLP